jgi:AraC-like DNA-binding protein
MRALLLDAYGPRRLSADAGAGQFQFEQVGFRYCAYDDDVEIEFPEVGSLRQQICLSGGGESIVERKSGALSRDETCVIPAGRKVATRFGAGYRQLILRVDPVSLHSKLEALAGTTLKNPIEFRLAQDFRTPQGQILQRMALFFASEAESFDSDACRLARVEFQQSLLAAFLSGNEHNYSYLLRAPAPGLAPRQIWLTEAYIEANWDKPLTIEEVSKATGVGARSLFKSFKEHRGYSPMAFAKDVRLKHARELLENAELDASVTAVAYRCGFQNHGHFARAYRIRYGEAPSMTLAGARRKRLG